MKQLSKAATVARAQTRAPRVGPKAPELPDAAPPVPAPAPPPPPPSTGINQALDPDAKPAALRELPEARAPPARRDKLRLSDRGLNHPVPLEPDELARARAWEEWHAERATRGTPASPTPLRQGVQVAIRKAENNIRNHMRPDDMASVFKENRGVRILEEDGVTPRNHLEEADNARRSLNNALTTFEGRSRQLARAKGKAGPKELRDIEAELEFLEAKRAEYQRILDDYPIPDQAKLDAIKRARGVRGA